MLWFVKDAPIRLKLLIAFGTLCGLSALPTLTALVAPGYVLVVGVLATLAGLVCAAWFRSAIATPYVTTVVRMEALAACDLTSPIQFTEYKDCVARMTKAMFSFRYKAKKEN